MITTNKLEIDIISDVTCPWCIIGYQSLIEAIKELGMEDSTVISWKAFQLNPNLPIEGQEISEHIQQKYGATAEQSAANREHIKTRGTDVDYKFDFADNGRIYNTFDAHRLIHWAKEYGLQTKLKLALFDLYFQQQGNPSNHSTLVKVAESVGLNPELSLEILISDQFVAEVRHEIASSQQKGIHSVPSFIFNNEMLVTGGHPKETFVNVINDLQVK